MSSPLSEFRTVIAGAVASRAGRRVRQAGLLLSIAATFAGCTKAQTQGISPAYLIIDQLAGASGAEPTKFTATLPSDVITFVKKQVDGKEVLVPTIYEDPGQVVFRLAMKDPGSATSATAPTTANFITVSRYHVQYVRSDGRNTPGVDVPYAFDGVLTATVGTDPTTAGITLVRVQSKEEAPLIGLQNAGAANAISTLAEVTFYGADQAGRTVVVVGHISVNFCNWGDPD